MRSRLILQVSLAIVLGGIQNSQSLGAAIAGPIVSPVNGYTYYLLAPSSWTASQLEAVTLGGNLATVRNQAENDWLVDTFARPAPEIGRNLWIGLNDAAIEDEFGWVSGEPFVYDNWFQSNEPALNEPNDGLGAGEDYAHIWGEFELSNRTGFWNDNRDDGGGGIGPTDVPFGVVEIVPEPDALVLIVSALVAFAGILRLRRRQSTELRHEM